MSIGSPEKMEPITKVSHIPSSRWALLCSLCEDKVGAAIQVRGGICSPALTPPSLSLPAPCGPSCLELPVRPAPALASSLLGLGSGQLLGAWPQALGASLRVTVCLWQASPEGPWCFRHGPCRLCVGCGHRGWVQAWPPSPQCSVRNCRTAFHVTCAFDRGLEMKTILADNDEVKFKSYCPKHSSPRPPCEAAPGEATAPQADPGSARKQKLQQLEDEFYTFVDRLDVARALRLPEDVVDFVFQYWKLRRRANLNQPLMAPHKDDDGDRGQQEALLRRLQLFTHLRQDLERVMMAATAGAC